jgi:hypothetical protein
MPLRRWLAAVATLATAGCSTPASDSRYVESQLPDRTTFVPVAQLLALRCGTLDCHGTEFRNLRIFGSSGLRFSSTDSPFSPTCNTSDEDDQDYLSVVGLEPETMSAVVQGGDPAMLTMVRKARGSESHKGGQIWAQGDSSDVCLTSWLGGTANAASCSAAAATLLPSPTTNPLLGCFTTP